MILSDGSNLRLIDKLIIIMFTKTTFCLKHKNDHAVPAQTTKSTSVLNLYTLNLVLCLHKMLLCFRLQRFAKLLRLYYVHELALALPGITMRLQWFCVTLQCVVPMCMIFTVVPIMLPLDCHFCWPNCLAIALVFAILVVHAPST